MEDLVEVYLAGRPDARDVPHLARALGAACDEASRAFEGANVERAELVAALAGLPRPLDELTPEVVREVALALGCARGDASALRTLEAEYMPAVHGALRAMKLGDDIRDEVLQEVRRKLLVPDGGAAKIAGYAGRGSLRGLLTVTATRTAISMLRKHGREAPADEALLDASGERDPELAYLKERYRGVFRDAFADAVAALDARERNLLRLHFLGKVTLDTLAEMYGVHRATIVRQVAKIRDALDAATRRALRERLGADRREVESVMDLIRSRFDVSVERLLKTMDEG